MFWRQQAACSNIAPGVFRPRLPPRGDPRQALDYCRRCPVVARCAAHALDVGERTGIVAGVWLSVDADHITVLRGIVSGRTVFRRCAQCWRLLDPEPRGKFCERCGFAEPPS